VHSFLRIALDEAMPDHSTISRTRRLIDADTHREVFQWVLERVASHGLLKGKTVGVGKPRRLQGDSFAPFHGSGRWFSVGSWHGTAIPALRDPRSSSCPASWPLRSLRENSYCCHGLLELPGAPGSSNQLTSSHRQRVWWARRDSNSRPPRFHRDALTNQFRGDHFCDGSM